MKTDDKNQVASDLQAGEKAVATAPENRAMQSPAPRELTKPDHAKRRPNSLSRKILPLIFFAGLILAAGCATTPARAQTTTVTGNFYDIDGVTPLVGATVLFVPDSTILISVSGLTAGPAHTVKTDSNGAFSIVLDPDNYVVQLPLIPGKSPFSIIVPPNSGTVNIKNIYVPASVYAIGFGASAGQYVLAGTGVTAVTNGNVVTLSASPGVGAGSNLTSRVSGGITLLEIPAGVTLQGAFAGNPSIIGSNLFSPFTHDFTNDPNGVLHEQHTTDGINWADDFAIDMNGNFVLSSGAYSGSGSGLTALNASQLTTGTVPAAQLPNPTASTIGGVKSLAAASHQFLTQISTTGVPSAAQPAFTDISGTATAAQIPIATSSTLGGVIPDGTSITVDAAGHISSTAGGGSSGPRITISGGGGMASAATRYYPPNGFVTGASAVGTDAIAIYSPSVIATGTYTLSNLLCATSLTALGAGQTAEFTVMTNEVASLIDCTVVGSAAVKTFANDTTHSATVTNGTTIVVRVITTGTASSSTASFHLEGF